MIWVIFISLLLFAFIFCMLANLAKLSSIKNNMKLSSTKTKKSKSNLINSIAKTIAPIIPLSDIKKIKLQKTLTSVSIDISPQEYTARYLVRTGVFVILTAILLLIWWPIALITGLLAVYTFINRKNEATRLSRKYTYQTEKELPRFVSYVSSRVKTTNNVLEIITDYKTNYDTILTKELAITVSDMKTGNQERALMNLQNRINSPLMTELCRGLVSAMRGDDVSSYFDSFSDKLSTLWNQRLKQEALKKEPKISRMTYVLLGSAFLSTFVVLGAVLLRSLSVISGVA